MPRPIEAKSAVQNVERLLRNGWIETKLIDKGARRQVEEQERNQADTEE